MKRLVHNERGGVFMSRNGKNAYDRGERPAFMIPSEELPQWKKTIPHHISRAVPTRFPKFPRWTRELVFFYAPPLAARSANKGREGA